MVDRDNRAIDGGDEVSRGLVGFQHEKHIVFLDFVSLYRQFDEVDFTQLLDGELGEADVDPSVKWLKPEVPVAVGDCACSR